MSSTFAAPSKPVKQGIFGNDPHLIAPKLLYFWINCVFYSVRSLMGIFVIEKCGLSAMRFGLVSSVAAINFVGAIFWSHLADKTGAYKPILAGTIFFYAIVFSLQGLNFEETVFPMFGIDYTPTRLMWVLIVISTVANFISSPIYAILDNLVLGMLLQNPSFSKELLGRQRLFSTFGHCAITGVSIGAQRLFAKEGEEDTGAMFIVMIVCAIIASLLVIFAIPPDIQPADPHQTPQPDKKLQDSFSSSQIAPAEGKKRSPAFVLLTSPVFLLFLLFVFVAGYIRTAMGLFSPVVIYQAAKANPAAKGAAGKDVWYIFYSQGPKLVSEVSVYFYGKELMKYFGVHWMLLMSQVTGIIRVFGYGLGKHRYLVLIWELMKGLNTGLFFTAAVRIANEIAPKGCGNSAQGLMSGVYNGIATAAASIIGGLQIDRHHDDNKGIKEMFVETAIGGTIVTVAFFVKFAVFDRVILVGNRSSMSARV